MWRWSVLSVVAVLSAAPAHAAGRFNCAVDDSNIKLTIDVGFETAAGHKFNHFRGAMIAKSNDVPAGFRKLILDSSQLMQSWGSEGELRLAVYAQNDETDASNNFNLLVMADGKATPMQGSYILTFGRADHDPLEFKGRLSCSVQ
jgi:hypothetical protein